MTAHRTVHCPCNPPEWLSHSLKTFSNLGCLDLGHGSQPTEWTADMIPRGAGSRLTSHSICLRPSHLQLPQIECLTRISSLEIINCGQTGKGDCVGSQAYLGSGARDGRPEWLAGVELSAGQCPSPRRWGVEWKNGCLRRLCTPTACLSWSYLLLRMHVGNLQAEKAEEGLGKGMMHEVRDRHLYIP